MNIIHLSKFTPYSFHVDPSISGTCLVFESTLQGYRAAVDWISKHSHKTSELYRLVVPYADKCKDVGDFLCLQPHERTEIKATYQSFGRNHTLDVVEKIQMIHQTDETWPFASSSRVIDLFMAVKYLENELILRDPLTGLSKIQRYFLDNKDLHEPEELIALVVFKFKVSPVVAREQLEALFRGNKPIWGLDSSELWVIPHVLINGPFPLAVDKVKEGICHCINYTKPFPWDLLHVDHPHCHGNVSSCVLSEDAEYIVALPYGVTVDAFLKANPEADARTCFDSCRFLASKSSNLCSAALSWDPVFANNCTFPTISSYVQYWINNMLPILVNKRADLEDEARTMTLKRKFLRSLYVGDEFQTNIATFKKCFMDESMEAKRARIDRFYEGHHEFLDLPVSLIDSEYFSFADCDPVPMHSKDLWIQLIKKF